MSTPDPEVEVVDTNVDGLPQLADDVDADLVDDDTAAPGADTGEPPAADGEDF